jgi:GTP-dependent phosphoenolpyruvate carboxykinase
LKIAAADLKELLHVDVAAAKAEVEDFRQYLATFGDRLPPQMTAELNALENRLG